METFLTWFFTSEMTFKFPPIESGTTKGPPFMFVFLVVLLVLSLVWVARDAARRGKSSWVAVVFVLFGWWPVSILFWRWLRPPLLFPPPLPAESSAD